ncbi:MAG: hypothetical protein L0Z55_01825 [Planctomycetes bacterium]|nr:hypothetical protein [Planctomycetota bacterium]
MAIVILAIALPPLLFAFSEGARDAVLAEKQTISAFLAQQKLEEIVADRHAAGRGYGYLASANYAAESPVAGFASFSRSVSFSEVQAADLATAQSGSGYKKAVVTVDYTGPTGSYVLTCVFCDI